MPSCQLFPQSGGIRLVSGNVFSGTGWPITGVQLKYQASGPGPFIFIGLPNLSGNPAVTINSGGSLSSGGLLDGWELAPGGSCFVPNGRLVSGIETIQIGVPTTASGGILYWQFQ